MDDLDKEMKMSFIDEARQLLEAAEQCFLDLESTRGKGDVIENIFRLAHNMKGTSRAVGFGEVAEFTHNLENLLLKLKEGKLSVDDETVNLLLECNDHLKVMVDALSVDMEAKFDSRELIAKINTKNEGGSIASSTTAHAADNQAGHEAAPSQPVIEVAPEPVVQVEAAASMNGDEQPLPAQAATPEIEALFASNAKPAGDAAPAAAANSASQPTEAQAPSSGDGGGKKAPAGQSQVEETIRVSVGRLEKLGDFIGELVILQTVLNQHRVEIESPLLQKTVQQLSKISKEIQDISMSLRMIPLKQTFAKLQRIVRDTSKSLGKEVELHLDGETTEVDKTVLEQVADPLVHIVRNAIDHGLEQTTERIQVGKSKEGNVQIRAFHQGNNLVIEVTDDGRGLNPHKIIKKAVQKGVIPPGTEMSDFDAIQLIFEPGFSTKDEVSEISGRGVGLDVVKTNVERLGGQVQLESELGQGSCFRILLPLTLAIIDGMIVQSGEDRYVVPIANVQETVQPKRDDVSVVTGKGEMLNLRDTTIPLVRLSHVLRSSQTKKQREPWQCIAIIANSRRHPFAILVDDILRQQQIVIKKLGSEIRVQKGLAGSAILGDGKPALILDLNDLMEGYVTGTYRGPGQARSAAA